MVIKTIFLYIVKLFTIQLSKVKIYYNKYKLYLESFIKKIDLTKITYDDLAPKDEIEKFESYSNALDWALNRDNVLNIALTGSYGSGKSSIIKAYQKNRPHNHYLNISLANFYEEKQINSNHPTQNKNYYDNEEIEKSILQQLFYKVLPSKIPYSRFRKLKSIRLVKFLSLIIIFVITLVLGIFLFKPKLVHNINSNIKELENLMFPHWLISLCYFIFVLLVLCQLIKIIQYCHARLKFSKVTIKNTEIEVKDSNNESVFNKYLDEILYFFEVTKYNIVFIEDLDRFNNTRIFTKLRELNSLINNSEQIKRKIVFIYAIKDDMFRNRDRTKFFDFIIPVIPVINATNSCDKLLEKLRQNDLGKEITDEYINGVSIYIDDMRILNNIYNEFVLYKNILSDVSLKPVQILSLIIYKNLYPNDFAELQYEKGIVYDAFESKKKFISTKIKELDSESKEIREKINIIGNEIICSVKELKVSLIYNLLGHMNSVREIRMGNHSYNISEIMGDNFDLSLIDNNMELIYGYNNQYTPTSMETANERSGNALTYIQRIDNVRLKSLEKNEELKSKIENLKDEIRKVSTYSLKDLIDRYEVISILPSNILEYKPIIYLLRNGFIDEMYPNYLTYFYENRLSATDMNFVLHVRNHESFEFTYKLVKSKELVAKLSPYEFEQEEVLNFDLMNYLLENKDSYCDQLKTIIKQLTNESSISVKFVDEFIERTRNLHTFINVMCKEWHNIWNYINEKSEYTSTKKDDYLLKILEYANLEDIEVLNCNGNMATYIAGKSNFLKLACNIDANRIKNVILKLKIQFIKLETENINKDLIDYIFDNNNYCLNTDMIETIIKVKAPELLGLISKSNLTTIKKLNYSPLLNYINNCLEIYIQDVFLKIDENTNEDIETIKVLLDSDLSEKSINKIIIKEEFKLSDISVVSEYLWDIIFSNLKLQANWNNIFYYFKKRRSINSILMDYLNKPEIYLKLSESKFNIDDENIEETSIHQDFFEQLILSEIICDSLESLVKSIPYDYDNFEISNMISEKVDILLNNKLLNFTVDNYNNLKENFKDKHIKLIALHKQEYLKEQGEYAVSTYDMLNILELSCFDNNELIQIISNIEISNIDHEIANLIYKYFLNTGEKYKMDISLFNKVWYEIETKSKLDLLINQIEFLDLYSTKNCLSELGKPYSQIINLAKRPTLVYSDKHLKLVEELDKRNFISSFKPEKSDFTHNKVKEIKINNWNKDVYIE